MAEISTHHLARNEVADAVVRLEASSVAQALRLMDEYDRIAAEIAADPERYPGHNETYRYAQLLTFPYYSVIYRFEGNTVRIVAFAHASRKPDYWQGRK